MKFNESQQIAVKHDRGPMLVIAGPGSGKTAVITGRTLNLCEQLGVNPFNILVITFTKAAAVEMKGRFDTLSKGCYGAVSFGTFHSVFFTILKSVYNYQSSNILREEERFKLIREIIDKYGIEYEDEKELVGQVLSEISLVKGEMMPIDSYCSANLAIEVFRNIYREYNQVLCNRRLIDFDDMLIRCYHLLKTNNEALKVWQNRFKYILIDEFQDINLVQYLIVKMLAAPENNIFVVGDDDQSIYSFRGAKPEIMQSFLTDYEEAKRILLDVNYRCTSQIVQAAGRVISNNLNRFPKDIKTVSKSTKKVSINEFNTVKAQYEFVVAGIQKDIKTGIKPEDIAVLFRTNSQARGIAGMMMEYNISFSVREGIPDIYEHFIAKDLFAYIRCAKEVISGRVARNDFLRIMNKPNRYMGRDCLAGSEVSLNSLCGFYRDKGWMVERIYELFEDLRIISEMTPYAAINYIRRKVGYDAYLKEYAQYRKIDLNELIELLEEFMDIAKGFDTFEEWEIFIDNYKEEMTKQTGRVKNASAKEEAVALMTFHTCKGLEFEKVYIIDVNEGITPHHKTKTDAGLEEERRMFYVAMTRAENELVITYSLNRFEKEVKPSRFIGEIYVSKRELKKGMNIKHKLYGNGRVLENDGERIRVIFDKDRVIKVFDINHCISGRIITID